MISERNLNVEIEVDGGITVDNVAEVHKAGADIVVMGSAFYYSKDYAETARLVRERCS
jgi:ribulose-phosphate 3-epimerase